MRQAPIIVLVIVLGVLVSACSGQRWGSGETNVVWIVIDALRADHLGCYGYEKDTSPFIDHLASKSVLFRNAIAQETYTQASVPSYFTSTYPAVHGVLYDHPNIDVLDSRLVTIAELLSMEGFATAAFVFNPHLKARFGFNQGSSIYDDNPEGWDPDQPRHEAFETAGKIYCKTEDYLSQNSARPVFLYLHYRDVHTPYAPPPPYHERFLPPGIEPVVDLLYDGKEKFNHRDHTEVFVSQYDGEIRYTDDYLGETLAMLREFNIDRDNSIIIITADHGEEFQDRHPNDSGGRQHGRTLDREQMNVPLIIALPGLEWRGRTVETFVELVDIVPTILDVLGIEGEGLRQFQGRSLLPMILGGREETRPVYCGGNHQRGAIIDNGWKFYRNDAKLKLDRLKNFQRPDSGFQYCFEEQLFNIDDDPYETQDLIKKEPVIAEKLRSALKRIEDALVPAGAVESIEMDEDIREKLEALGYL